MTAVPDAIFEPVVDGRFLPTELAIGPWSRESLHGGPPAALVAGALEQAIVAADLGAVFFPSRLTVELLRPVPLDELAVTTAIRRPGRKICLADAAITTPDGTTVLVATLQGIRVRPLVHEAVTDLHVPPSPATGAELGPIMREGPPAFHNAGVEHRLVRGTRFETPGPATDWIRLAAPLVAGRQTTPLERVVAAADFGNGVSQVFGMDDVLFVNPDLTVHLYRLPVGEWVCLDAVTRIGDNGVGLAESVLFDEQGPIGRSTQLLLVEPR